MIKGNLPRVDLGPSELELRLDGKPHNFALFEGGSVPRTISTEIYFLFDCERDVVTSSGFTGRLVEETLLSAGDYVKVGVYTFAGGLVRHTRPTRDREVLDKVSRAGFFTHALGTFLLDHIAEVARDAAATGPAVRVLLVLSDGVSDSVRSSKAAMRSRFDSAAQAASLASMAIYPVSLRSAFGSAGGWPGGSPVAGGPASPQSREPVPQADLRLLGDFTNLGSATGGKAHEVLAGTQFLNALCKSLGRSLQHQYVIGFLPPRSDPPRRHRVEIVLRERSRGEIVGARRELVY